jgi:hypothetical protein
MQLQNDSDTTRAVYISKLTVVGSKDNGTHNPLFLADAIRSAYFRDAMADMYVFDYDDTLVGKDNAFSKASKYNIESMCQLRNPVVCTGNSYKAVNATIAGNATVYADGGVNCYDRYGEMHHLSSECVIQKNEVDRIYSTLMGHISPAKIENRANTVIAIRPIDLEYIEIVYRYYKQAFAGYSLVVEKAGRSTIHIQKLGVNKSVAMKDILSGFDGTITYVGDELDCGNDEVIADMAIGIPRLKCLSVKNPVKTAYFISEILNSYYN